MRVAHILRKYNPAEWGGTESAMQLLLPGPRSHGVESVVYSPRLEREPASDPLAACGATMRRFHACLPVWGIPAQRRRQLVAVGGNLLSFELPGALRRESGLQLIHTHTLGRIGGIALTAARARRIPLAVSIHGGVLDLPDGLKRSLNGGGGRSGFEWGKLFGWFFQARRLLEKADAILTCNAHEAALLQERYPRQRVVVQPHGVPLGAYAADHRAEARRAFPQLRGRQVVLCVGRIDSVKNQNWLVEQAPEILRHYPQALLVLAGACTDEAYGAYVARRAEQLGVQQDVLLTGGLPPGDPRLIGLLQEAEVIVVPSISETFGLVILEAWAAGTPVIASRTSGAQALIRHGQDGWLFGLHRPLDFHAALGQTLCHVNVAEQLAAAGRERVAADYDSLVLAGRMKRLYDELVAEKSGGPRLRPASAPQRAGAAP